MLILHCTNNYKYWKNKDWVEGNIRMDWKTRWWYL